jgi:hypothetical protein
VETLRRAWKNTPGKRLRALESHQLFHISSKGIPGKMLREIFVKLDIFPSTAIRILTTWSEFSEPNTRASTSLRLALNLQQFPAFEEALKNHARHRFVLMDKINKEPETLFLFPRGNYVTLSDNTLRKNLALTAEIKGCSTSSTSCCAGYEDTIAMPVKDLNSPRRLNRELGPVIQNIHIAAPIGPALSIFSTCIPCGVNGYRQEIVFALRSFRPSSVAHFGEYWLGAKRQILFTLE